MSAAVQGLRVAAGTLTLIPVGHLPMPITRPVARWAMALAAPAVLPLGLAAAGLGWAGRAVGLPALVTAVCVVGLAVYLTRGMHVDGLADTVDGFGAGWDRERALAVMKTGDVGPMGTAALILVLGAQIACATVLLGLPWGYLVVGAAICLARTSTVICCLRAVPSARPGGMGSVMAGTQHPAAAVLVAAAAVGALSGLAVAAGLPWWQGLVAGCAAFTAVGLLVLRARRVFGGVTGDVIGAGIEIWLTVALVLLSAGGW